MKHTTIMMLALSTIVFVPIHAMQSKVEYKAADKAARAQRTWNRISTKFDLFPAAIRYSGDVRAGDGAQFFDAQAKLLQPRLSSSWYNNDSGYYYVPASTQTIHDLALFSEVLTCRGEQFLIDIFSGKQVTLTYGQCHRVYDAIRLEGAGSKRWEELYALVTLLKIKKFKFLRDIIAQHKAADARQHAAEAKKEQAVSVAPKAVVQAGFVATYAKPHFTAENYQTEWDAYPLFPHDSLARSVVIPGSTDRMAYCRSGKWVDIYELQSPAAPGKRAVYSGYRILREEYDRVAS